MHPWNPEAEAKLDQAWDSALEMAAWAGWQEASACHPPHAVEDIDAEERALRSQAARARRQAAGQLQVRRDPAEDRGVAAAAKRLAADLTEVR